MCFFVCFVFQTLVLWYMNSSQMEIFGSSCSFKNTSKRWLFFFFIALLPLFHDVFHMCRTQWKNRTTFLIQVSVFDAKDVMGAIWLLSFSVKEGCSTQKWWLSYVSFSDKWQLKLLRTKLPFSLPYTHTSLHFNATSLYVLLSPVISASDWVHEPIHQALPSTAASSQTILQGKHPAVSVVFVV